MDKLFVRKDVYEELLEKGFGKKDLSKLTKKKITDKNGHTRTVYVRNGEQPAEVKQPKAQEGLSDEKRAKYEEMLEKVVAGPEDNALFIGSRGMLNKKEAIAYLSEKLGKHAGNAIKNANAKANNLTSMSKDDKIAILSEYMHQKYSSVSVEEWKKTYNAKLSDKELDEAFKDFSETHQNRIKEYQKKKPVSSAAQGHLESDTLQNTDITKEDEERFGKQALSGLSGKRTGSNNTAQKMANAEDKAFEESEKDAQKKYGNMSIEELKAEAKKYDGVSKYSPEAVEARKVYDVLNQKLEEEKKENYLDAKNEAGKDIAENNKIETLSEKIEFSPDEMKMIRDTAKEIGYKVGKDEGKLLNAINSKDKAMYSALTKKNQKVWDESGKKQKTFSQTDLLKEKIESMNGDFGADDPETTKKMKAAENKKEIDRLMKVGFDRRSAYAKVALDEIEERLNNEMDDDIRATLFNDIRDIQSNGLNAKYFEKHKDEYGF